MTIPKLSDVSPTIAELRDERAEIGAQVQPLREELLAVAQSPREHAPQETNASVAALLGRAPPPAHSPREERLAEIRRQISTREAAVELLDREIAAEVSRASASVREEVKPEARMRLRTLGLALAAAHRASFDYEMFLDALRDDGVIGLDGFTSANIGAIGHPRSPYSPVAMVLQALAKEGVLTSKELPEPLR